MEDYPEVISPARALLLPDDFWQLIQKLAQSESDRPSTRLTEKQFPEYCSPQSNSRAAFNTGLNLLANARIFRVLWEPNSSQFASSVQLIGGRDALIALLRRHRPNLLPSEKADREIPIGSICQVVKQHGPLGLRTAAHVVLGDSHSLDNIGIEKRGISNLWIQPDVIVQGSSIVRVAGRFGLKGSNFEYYDTWDLPGHIIWRWQLDQVEEPARVTTGSHLFLIENPYPYWELIKRWAGEDITFICLHGETRHGSFVESDAALQMLLAKIFKCAPNCPTGIWCDPDPGGLAIASHTYNLIKQFGGHPFFVGMGVEIVEWIKTIVIPESKFFNLKEKERVELTSNILHPSLQQLKDWMMVSGKKGEQEGLVIFESEINKQLKSSR